MNTITTLENDGLAGLGAGVLLVIAAVYLAIIVFSIYIYVRIIHKAGYSGWWVLATFVPILNLVVVIMFAFAEWPVERRVREVEHRLAALPPGPGGYGQQPGINPY